GKNHEKTTREFRDGSPFWIRIEPCALRPKGLFAGFWRKCGQLRAGDAPGTLYGTRGMGIAATREPAPAKLAQNEGRVFSIRLASPASRSTGQRRAPSCPPLRCHRPSIDADRLLKYPIFKLGPNRGPSLQVRLALKADLNPSSPSCRQRCRCHRWQSSPARFPPFLRRGRLLV